MKKTRCEAINFEATNLAMEFAYKYFWKDNNLDVELSWVESSPDELHMNLFIGGYYFSLDTIYTALYYNIPKDKLLAWYDHVQRSYMEGSVHHSLKNRYLMRHPTLANTQET